MVCKHCEKEINENAAFCPFCGTKVEKIKTCNNCGNNIDNEALFCSNCGMRIKKQEDPKPENNEITKSEIREYESEDSPDVTGYNNEKNDRILNYFTMFFAILACVMSCVTCYMVYWY